MGLLPEAPDHLVPLDRWRYRYVASFSGLMFWLMALFMVAELATGTLWAPVGQAITLLSLVATFSLNRMGRLRLASWILLGSSTIDLWILAPYTTPLVLPLASSVLIAVGLLLGARAVFWFSGANLIYLGAWLGLRPGASLLALGGIDPPVGLLMFFVAIMTVNGWFIGVITQRTIGDLQAALRRANTDWLTGLANRSGFGQRLDEALSLARRHRVTFSVLLLDVDFFKRINDTYGHPAGDSVLQALARSLEADARKSDCVARYGGEEFALLLPHTDRNGALILAERIRRNVSALLIFDEHHRRIAVTISIGISEFGATDHDATALISHADRALYRAKQSGRDRSEVYQEAA